MAEEVEEFLDTHPSFLERLAQSPTVNPEKAPSASLNLEQVVEAPPEQIGASKEFAKPWLSLKGQRIDFAERDALNRHMAKLGEEFVVRLERHRLKTIGRDDLAEKVEWVAHTIGDGLGFDVLSYEQDESKKLIEVKTTGLGKFFPFYVSSNEVRCSEDMADQFHLFRVFDFACSPTLYILSGSLRANCQLEPIQFRATI